MTDNSAQIQKNQTVPDDPPFEKKSNLKFKFSLIITILIIAAFVISIIYYGFSYPKIQSKISQIKQKGIIQTYSSPIGISFENSQGSVSEYDFTSFCEALNQPSLPRKQTTSSSEATDITFNSKSLPEIIAIKMSAIGTKTSQEQCAPGDLGAYRFFYKDDNFFNDFQNLISNKISPSQSQNFNDKGINQRFDITSYKNYSSGIFGITNLDLFGFAVPGLSIKREYFLHDPRSKFIIYISYPIDCDKKNEFEKKQNSEIQNQTFNGDSYIKNLHELAPDCDQNSIGAQKTLQLISTLRFLQ